MSVIGVGKHIYIISSQMILTLKELNPFHLGRRNLPGMGLKHFEVSFEWFNFSKFQLPYQSWREKSKVLGNINLDTEYVQSSK